MTQEPVLTDIKLFFLRESMTGGTFLSPVIRFFLCINDSNHADDSVEDEYTTPCDMPWMTQERFWLFSGRLWEIIIMPH
jgi:hypothetical protein